MSIQSIQTQNIIQDIAQNYFSSGVIPDLNDVLGRVSNFLAFFPPGTPLPTPDEVMTANQQSNVDSFNEAMARLVYNLYVLYRSCSEQIEESLQLVSTLTSRLDYISSKRQQMLTTINDYLLSLNNTSGYFFSLSDNFANLSKIDLTLTSAFVDPSTQTVLLPTLSSLTTRIPPSLVQDPAIAISINGVAGGSYNTISSFNGALDGLENTAWAISVTTTTPSQVSVQMTNGLGDANNTVTLSRFDFAPYGITPVQMFGKVLINTSPGISGSSTSSLVQFGNLIQTSTDKMVLIDKPVDAVGFQTTLIKDNYDYITPSTSGPPGYVYIFGAKEIVFTEMVYDNTAILLSQPLTIPSDVQNEMFIDAVSLTVKSNVPANTNIKYYLATDNGAQTQLTDFSWSPVDPIGTINSKNTIINFNGTQPYSTHIRTHPESNDLQLIQPDDLNADLSLRNPSQVIVPGIDIWHIAKFSPTNIPTPSLTLLEGINTTRIYSQGNRQDLISPSGLSLWAQDIQSTSPPTLQYGRIDTGNKFFYGGDIGESDVSIFLETYLDSLSLQSQFLADCIKLDINSKTWDIRVFLNGNELGYLPAGIDGLTLPWLFKQGLNHICMVINIPDGTQAIPKPYLGMLELMLGHNLYDYGTVQLNTWKYVSFFDLQYNATANQPVFSIFNNEIISRRQPTDNFLLKYAIPTTAGPSALRFRADLSRDTNNINLTPQLNSYQLNFAFGGQ